MLLSPRKKRTEKLTKNILWKNSFRSINFNPSFMEVTEKKKPRKVGPQYFVKFVFHSINLNPSFLPLNLIFSDIRQIFTFNRKVYICNICRHIHSILLFTLFCCNQKCFNGSNSRTARQSQFSKSVSFPCRQSICLPLPGESTVQTGQAPLEGGGGGEGRTLKRQLKFKKIENWVSLSIWVRVMSTLLDSRM